MKAILITGGAGFVGSSIALHLRRRRPSLHVIAADNLRRRGSEFNLERLRAAGVAFVHADIRNAQDVAQLPRADALLECSAEPSALAGYDGAPGYTVETNLLGTFHCLEWARQHRAGVVFYSSSRVYPIPALNALRYAETDTRFVLSADQSTPGASANGISESFPLDGHRSLYGATKLCSEHLLTEYIAMYGVRGVVNRCGLIAGSWQMGKIDQGVIVFWIASHIYGRPLRYIGYGGSGKQVRDVLHVEDLATLTLKQLDRLDEINGSVFNVGGGLANTLSLHELTQISRELTGETVDIQSEPDTRPGDIPIYVTDFAKAAAELGFHPEWPIARTCEEIARWIVDNRARLEPILAG